MEFQSFFNPLVSIIIPTYGGGDNLRRAISSALAQDYHNIEIIVVDDNGLGTESQKSTSQIMSEFVDEKRIVYLCHNKNINGSAARNTGFRASKGEYICVLDDDDEYLPNFVSTHIDIHKSLSSSYALTYTRINYEVNGRIHGPGVFFPEDDVCLLPLFTKIYGICSCSYLMRRSVFEQVGGYDESFKRHQDWEFLVRVVYKYRKVKGIDKVCYIKHQIQRNTPTDPAVSMSYRLHFLQILEPLMRELTNKERKQVLDYHMMDLGCSFLVNHHYVAFIRLVLKYRPGKIGLEVLKRKFFNKITRLFIHNCY